MRVWGCKGQDKDWGYLITFSYQLGLLWFEPYSKSERVLVMSSDHWSRLNWLSGLTY